MLDWWLGLELGLGLGLRSPISRLTLTYPVSRSGRIRTYGTDRHPYRPL